MDNIAKRRFSWQNVTDAIKSCAERFPLTVMYVVALVIWLDVDVWTDCAGPEWRKIRDILAYGLSVGALLSLVIYLWDEERQVRKCAAFQAVASLLLAVDCVWLFAVYDTVGNAVLLGHAAVIVSLIVAVFFVSFIGEKRDMVSWNFSRSIFVSVCVTALIALAMTMATGAIAATLTLLFDLPQWWELYATMLLVGAFAIPVMIFLGRIPAGAAKHDAVASPSRFLTGVVRYLFLPTVAIFYGVLYVYALKILLRWKLPDGDVAWSVTWAIVAGVLIEYLLYPSRMASRSRLDDMVARWLPAALLPLLVLMTVALCRRIGDYGITVSRLYMLTLNLWGYGMCAWLWLTRARRVGWIPVSCALLFFITSALPVLNYTTVTELILRSQVGTMLEEYGAGELPVSVADYNGLVDGLPRDDQNRLEGKFRYLLDNYGKDAVASLVTVESGSLREWTRWSAVHADTLQSSYSRQVDYTGDIDVPCGYPVMRRIMYLDDFRYVKGGMTVVTVKSVEFGIDVDSIRRANNTGGILAAPVVCRPVDGSDDVILVVDKVYYYYPDAESLTSLSLSGFMFKRNQ